MLLALSTLICQNTTLWITTDAYVSWRISAYRPTNASAQNGVQKNGQRVPSAFHRSVQYDLTDQQCVTCDSGWPTKGATNNEHKNALLFFKQQTAITPTVCISAQHGSLFDIKHEIAKVDEVATNGLPTRFLLFLSHPWLSSLLSGNYTGH